MVWPFSSSKNPAGLDSLKGSAENYVIIKLQSKLDKTIHRYEEVELDKFGMETKIRDMDKVIRDHESLQKVLDIISEQVAIERKSKQDQKVLEQSKHSHLNDTQTVALNRATLQLDQDIEQENGNYRVRGRAISRLPARDRFEYVNGVLRSFNETLGHAREVDELLRKAGIGPPTPAIRLDDRHLDAFHTAKKKFPRAQEYDHYFVRTYERMLVKLSEYRDELESLSKKMIALQAKLDRTKQKFANKGISFDRRSA